MENTTKTSIVNNFYSHFKNKNSNGMIELYHDNVTFKDPAFGELKGDKAKMMWKMLIEGGSDLVVTYSDIKELPNGDVTAKWEAKYTFSATNKKVHNKMDATFKFENGKIISHTDEFNFKKWASQALGFKGKLFGSTNFLKKKVTKMANERLDNYMNR